MFDYFLDHFLDDFFSTFGPQKVRCLAHADTQVDPRRRISGAKSPIETESCFSRDRKWLYLRPSQRRLGMSIEANLQLETCSIILPFSAKRGPRHLIISAETSSKTLIGN